MSSRKGYLQIDFAFVVLFFTLLFFAVYSIHSSEMKDRKNELEIQQLHSQSEDICYMLVSGPGQPTNWQKNISSLKVIGLSSTTNHSLDSSKINALNLTNYLRITNSLNIDSYPNIHIEGMETGTVYADLGRNVPSGSLFEGTACYSNYNGEHVKVEVEVWK